MHEDVARGIGGAYSLQRSPVSGMIQDVDVQSFVWVKK